MILAIITLLSGLLISCVSGYFSVVGLSQLFAASFWSIIIMGTVIELGKIIAATWLHKNWNNTSVGKLHKLYLIIAIILTMSITSLGIFGFLSKAHLDQKAPVIQQLTEENNSQNQITFLKTNLQDLQKNLDSINGLSGTKNTNSLDRQRRQIMTEMTKTRNQIIDLNKNVLKNTKETSEVELKLGPVKYLADLVFGTPTDQNIDRAVQIFIVMIMIVFDPLAIMLILSANITFREYAKSKLVVQKPIKDYIEPTKPIDPIIDIPTIPEVIIEDKIIKPQESIIVQEQSITKPAFAWAAFAAKKKE